MDRSYHGDFDIIKKTNYKKMKNILLIAAIVLSLSACDNTKVRLSAPPPVNSDSLSAAQKTDTLQLDTLQKDSTILSKK